MTWLSPDQVMRTGAVFFGDARRDLELIVVKAAP
jgi:hypothetical protein